MITKYNLRDKFKENNPNVDEKNQCINEIDYIYIDEKGIRYHGITLSGYAQGSNWSVYEDEMSKWNKIEGDIWEERLKH